MNVHTEILCNVCKKGNFNGKRYKCLLCFDYDMCSSCYELKDTPKSDDEPHNSTHAIQCIIPKDEFALYYAGENVSFRSILSFTCPLCAKTGFTEQALKVHVVEHTTKQNPLQLVVCPICLAEPIDDTIMTDDIASHIKLEHLEDGEEDDDDSEDGGDEQIVAVQQNLEPTRLNMSQLNRIRQRVLSLQRNVTESVLTLESHAFQDINSNVRVAEQRTLRQVSPAVRLPRVLRDAASRPLRTSPEVRLFSQSANVFTAGSSRQGIEHVGPPVIRVFSQSLDVPRAIVSPRTSNNTSRPPRFARSEGIDMDYELAAQLQRFEEHRARRGGGEIPPSLPRSGSNANSREIGGISHLRVAHELRMAAFARHREAIRNRYEAMYPSNHSKNLKKPKIEAEIEEADKEATESPEPQESPPEFLLPKLFQKMELDECQKSEEERTTFVNELLLSSLMLREKSLLKMTETTNSNNMDAGADKLEEPDN